MVGCAVVVSVYRCLEAGVALDGIGGTAFVYFPTYLAIFFAGVIPVKYKTTAERCHIYSYLILSLQ